MTDGRTKERLVEETARGNWSGAAGVGIVGMLLSLGLVPALIIILSLMAVGIVLIVYLLPILLAGAVAVFAYYVSKEAGLTGMKMVGAVFMAAIGSLLLFTLTDITLFYMNSLSPVTGNLATSTSVGKAQFLDFLGDAVRIVQLIFGMLVVVFVLTALQIIGKFGDAGSVVVALGSMFFVGIIVSSYFDIRIPGLAEGAQTESFGTMVSAMIAAGVGLLLLYASWRLD